MTHYYTLWHINTCAAHFAFFPISAGFFAQKMSTVILSTVIMGTVKNFKKKHKRQFVLKLIDNFLTDFVINS